MLSLATVQATIGHAVRAANEEFQPPLAMNKQTTYRAHQVGDERRNCDFMLYG